MTVAPLLGASSGKHVRAWPVWPQLVEFSYGLLGILQVAGWLPGRSIIAFPLDKILESVVEVPAIEDSFNLPLFFSIDNNWWWWR